MGFRRSSGRRREVQTHFDLEQATFDTIETIDERRARVLNLAQAAVHTFAELLPARRVAERVVGADALIEASSGALLISRRPKLGSDAFACLLYPGVGPGSLNTKRKFRGGETDSLKFLLFIAHCLPN